MCKCVIVWVCVCKAEKEREKAKAENKERLQKHRRKKQKRTNLVQLTDSQLDRFSKNNNFPLKHDGRQWWCCSHDSSAHLVK